MSGPYEQIYDELQGYFSELPGSHTLGIAISGPYEQISYDYQYIVSWLPDNHIQSIGIFFPHELPGCVAWGVFSLMFDIHITDKYALHH